MILVSAIEKIRPDFIIQVEITYMWSASSLRKSQKIVPVFLLMLSGILLSTGSFAQSNEFDVVILNGRVMDPQSGFDDVRNVGVKDGRIVTITGDAIEGVETIDATGHAVVPGFIDTHIHGQSAFSYKMFLRDGMTTALSLENGSLQIAKFYEDRAGGALMNYGTGVSHEFARIAVMDGVIATEDSYLYPIRAARAEPTESRAGIPRFRPMSRYRKFLSGCTKARRKAPSW